MEKVDQIPFLPIRFFKTHEIKTGDFSVQKVFESSGTAGDTSKNFMENMAFYDQVSSTIFSNSFGTLDGAVVIGLLPSYLERDNSSLVHMVNHFFNLSKNKNSGFYLNQMDVLCDKLKSISEQKEKVYLFGVTFALLEFAEKYHISMENLCILETGGMKGRGRELTREELHQKLKDAFAGSRVSSEYGMTELLSQAYLQKDGYFHGPSWMRVMTREILDPFKYTQPGETGVMCIIDLANIHSCAFIETEDLGVCKGDGFKVIGRLDNSDVRGCNLMVS